MKQAERYSRNRSSLSEANQELLASSTVAIVGCGGLGGYMAEEFTRIGVGHLILIDGDKIDVTNLNRQLIATEQNLGQWKVVAAQERLKIVNSTTLVTVYKEWFDLSKKDALLNGAHVVCDALDSITCRIELERACHELSLPLVFASIAGWYGMIGISYPGDQRVARLLGQGTRGIENKWGNPAFTPAVLASLSVAEAVKILIGRPVALRRSWLHIDLLTMEFERFEIL